MSPETSKTAFSSKVGFDLDGVLFYNPLRIIRKPADFIKKGATLAYIPKTKLEQFLWRIIHQSSFKPADGWQDIKALTQEGIIMPYVITARFKCLKDDFTRCMHKIDASTYFAGQYQNLQDELPHRYKERMIHELGIEYYIEDNWNIVEYLNKVTKATILWVSNPLDADIPYDYRFDNLKDALVGLRNMIQLHHTKNI